MPVYGGFAQKPDEDALGLQTRILRLSLHGENILLDKDTFFREKTSSELRPSGYESPEFPQRFLDDLK